MVIRKIVEEVETHEVKVEAVVEVLLKDEVGKADQGQGQEVFNTCKK
jgi:hypothetical protein